MVIKSIKIDARTHEVRLDEAVMIPMGKLGFCRNREKDEDKTRNNGDCDR